MPSQQMQRTDALWPRCLLVREVGAPPAQKIGHPLPRASAAVSRREHASAGLRFSSVVPPPHAFRKVATGDGPRRLRFPTPHERRAAFPQRTGSLTSHCRPCNSKSRKKLKWNPVIPCISAPAAAVKQSSVNPCDSIRTAVLHGDWRIVGSERGILKMYWQCCNTHPGGTAEFKQDQGNVRGNYATAIVA
jgi:hypothetical protein